MYLFIITFLFYQMYIIKYTAENKLYTKYIYIIKKKSLV